MNTDYIRSLAEIGLDEAIFAILKFTIHNISGRALPIHPDTLNAYNELAIKLVNKEL